MQRRWVFVRAIGFAWAEDDEIVIANGETSQSNEQISSWSIGSLGFDRVQLAKAADVRIDELNRDDERTVRWFIRVQSDGRWIEVSDLTTSILHA